MHHPRLGGSLLLHIAHRNPRLLLRRLHGPHDRDAALVRDGTTLLWAAPDAGTEESVPVTLVGATALDGEWSVDLLVADATADTETHAAYVAVEDGAEPDAAFARLHMEKGW